MFSKTDVVQFGQFLRVVFLSVDFGAIDIAADESKVKQLCTCDTGQRLGHGNTGHGAKCSRRGS